MVRNGVGCVHVEFSIDIYLMAFVRYRRWAGDMFVQIVQVIEIDGSGDIHSCPELGGASS